MTSCDNQDWNLFDSKLESMYSSLTNIGFFIVSFVSCKKFYNEHMFDRILWFILIQNVGWSSFCNHALEYSEIHNYFDYSAIGTLLLQMLFWSNNMYKKGKLTYIVPFIIGYTYRLYLVSLTLSLIFFGIITVLIVISILYYDHKKRYGQLLCALVGLGFMFFLYIYQNAYHCPMGNPGHGIIHVVQAILLGWWYQFWTSRDIS